MKPRIVFAVACCALAGVARAAGVTGTYVGTAPNSAVLLQLVQTRSGSVEGRFEQYYLPPRGTQVQITNASVSGAAADHTVVLQIKLAEALGGTIPASGDLQGNAMNLSGGRMGSTFDFHLVRSDMDAFQGQLRRLNDLAMAQAQIQASAAADRERMKQLREGRENLQSATSVLQKIDAATPAELHLIASITARFSHFTHVMQRLLDREQATMDQYQRGQVAYTIGEGAYRTDAQHFDLGQQEFKTGYEHGRITPPSADSSVGHASAFCANPLQAKTPPCAEFANALARWTADRHELNAAFAKAEAIYAAEHAEQSHIQQQANVLAYQDN